MVKGKHEPIGIFEMLDYHTEESFPNLSEALQYFKAALPNYRAKQWDKAINLFNEAALLNPQDPMPRMYLDRCRHFKSNPPGEDWNGIWVLESK